LPFCARGRRFSGIFGETGQGPAQLMTPDIDPIDVRILDIVQNDASLSVAEIADQVGLSSSPCWRRIKRLEDAGVIERRVTLLNREALGLGFEVMASVKLGLPSRANLDAFEDAVREWPEVVDCVTVTGAVDYMIRVVTTDMHAYDAFLRDKLLGLGTVADVQSRIVMRVAKRTTAAPLGLSLGKVR
jgi:Lrp/AsnC family transcriptional regulator